MQKWAYVFITVSNKGKTVIDKRFS